MLQYAELDSDVLNTIEEANVKHYHLGANYNFDQINGFQPYLGGGVGKLKIDRTSLNRFSNTSLDLNAGVKYFFNSNWMAKFQAMMIEPDSGDMDLAFSLSIGYVFGSANSRSAMPAARSNPPVPATAPAPPAPVDSDGDGVVDAQDACPNTNRNLAVDARGCVILDEEQRRQTLSVLFDTDMSDIKDEYQDGIAEFAEFLREYNNTRATIEGHTDSDGTEAYNQALSERRANAIRNELIMR